MSEHETIVLTCPACGSTNVIETDWEEPDGPGTGGEIPLTEKCRDCGAYWDAGAPERYEPE